MVFITFLPIAMWRHLQYATIALSPLIAFLLAGVEYIGIMIENPMRILPMAAYCASIHTSVMYVGADWAAGNYVCPLFLNLVLLASFVQK
jgi:predicted membrane chloride channel (bestrophin family)